MSWPIQVNSLQAVSVVVHYFL